MKFTRIYYDVSTLPDGEQKLLPYVRLCPDFMNTGDTCFWHGLSISSKQFTTESEAEKFSEMVEKFMQRMVEDYEATDKEQQ